MASQSCFMSMFLGFFTAMVHLSASSLSKVPVQSDKPMGIFLLGDGEKYTLNFTEATAACLLLNVTIATEAQMQEAVQHGLETCKYGWVAEMKAVIPRIKPDPKCGAGKSGMVVWQAALSKKFMVYCFNTSAITDQNQTLKPSTASPQPPRSSTSLEAMIQTSAYSASTYRSTTRLPPIVDNPTKQTPSASDPFTETTDQPSSSLSSSSVKHLSPYVPLSPNRLSTPIPPRVTFAVLTCSPSSSPAVSSELSLQPSVSPASLQLSAAHIVLISLSIILLLLTAVTAWWCYKAKICRLFVRQLHKDDVETEMWKNTHSEIELQSEDGAEMELDEELSMKYSSDITLCVNPCLETNSLE
ncbi:lymphatic vessel endothelial hyaluronic acid receptor 1-like isoform X1 [Cyprinodon tularosa]|uniref:lymphatic vessel endothelial hyaluronic acid receptor 1-like isoform X1 n=2 Tax=Cyprinodon tularosa TaxID=77115 RepID=UPI0018E202A7|nr:lymphatic vessel endothelial hyaluronic acid receptor 1-like isoform X1 [Cyprinodon tularosa]